MGVVTVGYKCHRSWHLASGGQWLGMGWAPWRLHPHKPMQVKRHTQNTLSKRNIFSIGSLGPLTSSVAFVVDPIVEKHMRIPIVSLATNDNFSDKRRYPYFVRIMPPDKVQGVFLSLVLQHYSWLPACILTDTGAYGLALGTAVFDIITYKNSTLRRMDNITQVLDEVRVQECRTIVFCGGRVSILSLLEYVSAYRTHSPQPKPSWGVRACGPGMSILRAQRS